MVIFPWGQTTSQQSLHTLKLSQFCFSPHGTRLLGPGTVCLMSAVQWRNTMKIPAELLSVSSPVSYQWLAAAPGTAKEAAQQTSAQQQLHKNIYFKFQLCWCSYDTMLVFKDKPRFTQASDMWKQKPTDLLMFNLSNGKVVTSKLRLTYGIVTKPVHPIVCLPLWKGSCSWLYPFSPEQQV